VCGIGGVIAEDVSRLTGPLEGLAERLAHRGPDDHGIYLGPPAGLVHRRLSILDLSQRGHQPMTTEDGRFTLVHNGEVYNFRELRKDLEGRGCRFYSDSDTEVILQYFALDGEACLEHLRGQFAFAVWDRDRRRLFLVRDRLGMKPVYYSSDGGRFAFASELRALLGLPWVSRQMDREAIAQFLAYQYVPAPRTGLQSCAKLPAGHYLTVDADSGTVSTREYWRPQAPGRDRPAGDVPLVDDVEATLIDSVNLRLVSDVEVGVLLSGGLDSSLIAALATRSSETQLKTFSVRFEETALDESRFARSVADYLGTEHHELDADSGNDDSVETFLDHLDEPLGDPACLPTYLIAQQARKHVKVVLSGEGADEIFLGYPHYVREYGTQWLWRLPGSFRHLVGAMLGPIAAGRTRGSKVARRLGEVLRSSAEVGPTRWVTVFGKPEISRMLSPDFREVMNPATVFQPIVDLYRSSDQTSVVGRGMEADLRSWLPEDLLMKVDKMTMAIALEARAPFLDHQLVEVTQRLSPAAKFRGRQTKAVLKEIALKYLPQDIVHRKKHGFEVPLARWLNADLSRWTENAFSLESLSRSGIFDAEVVHQMSTRMRATGSVANPRAMWLVFILVEWLSRNRIDS